jgi:hypothetical protein
MHRHPPSRRRALAIAALRIAGEDAPQWIENARALGITLD